MLYCDSPRLGSLWGLFVHRPRHISSPFCPLNKALGSGVTPCPHLQEFPANGHSSGNAKSFSSWMGRWDWGNPTLGRVQQAQLVDISQPVVFFQHLSGVPQPHGGDAGPWCILLASGFSLLLLADSQPGQLCSQPTSAQPRAQCPAQHELSAPWDLLERAGRGQLSPELQGLSLPSPLRVLL